MIFLGKKEGSWDIRRHHCIPFGARFSTGHTHIQPATTFYQTVEEPPTRPPPPPLPPHTAFPLPKTHACCLFLEAPPQAQIRMQHKTLFFNKCPMFLHIFIPRIFQGKSIFSGNQCIHFSFSEWFFLGKGKNCKIKEGLGVSDLVLDFRSVTITFPIGINCAQHNCALKGIF